MAFFQSADKRFQAPRRLPVLQLDSGHELFSSNIASSFIFSVEPQVEESVEKWLHWEATDLQPMLALIGGKSDSSRQIQELLLHLDTSLTTFPYLICENLTVADICIWVAIYPLYTEQKFKVQYLDGKENIIKWFEKLYTLDQFTCAERKLNGQQGVVALQSAQSACWYPSPLWETSSSSSPLSQEGGGQVSDEEIVAAVVAWRRGVITRVKMKSQPPPVLPVEGEKNILITSSLPYVNNVPHLGNIIGCVLSADVFARYCRSRGRTTLYICGTDEYGTATETKALEEGLTPQEICDKYFAIHNDIYSWFSISFDHFGRTTTKEQTQCVQEIFAECHKNGYTSVSEVDQLFCEKCQRFLADRFVEGTCPNCKFEDARGDQCDGCGHLINAVDLIRPRCKLCQGPPILRQSQQLFLDLQKVEEQLLEWVETTSGGWSNNARVIAKSWLNRGLRSRCITRDLKWGVPVPLQGFDSKVFYVWFDAPIGYMSLTKCYTEDWLRWWSQDPKYQVVLYQFMAKDNVPFHSIMFPATLLATRKKYTMLNHLMATEYLNYEDGKFSKSRGIGVFGNDAKETGIPSDIFRFYLLYIRPENQDSNFSWSDFALKVNTELLNNVGNFFNRALMFADKFYDGIIPAIVITAEEERLLGQIRTELKGYIASLEKARLREGVKYILNISRHGNLYIQSQKPWELIKGGEEDRCRAGTVVGLASNMVALITSLLQPYMPQTVKTLAQQLNLPEESFVIQEDFSPFLEEGHKIGKPFPIFKKIEASEAEAFKAKYAGRQKSNTPEVNMAAKVKTSSLSVVNTNDYRTALKSTEEAVAKQGDLVRQMKAEGKSKAELQPMISVLLDLKKQLAELKAECEEAASTDGGNEGQINGLTRETPTEGAAVGALEAQVASQAEKVRQLKSAGGDKASWGPEVTVLLELKRRLAAAQGLQPTTTTKTNRKNKKK